VYPGEADIAQNRVSILTPIGAALIGLSVGQSIAWSARDGRQQVLTVLSVEPPAATAEVLQLQSL
jgi:regulator of nucleoside diphosphate kinase